ncbi:hypothetical protein [Gordonibacter massiliensis (ex Traore et al. 2017)]|uniref:hypothetical protein n=1 Tax=Gordonibacter massiliensis (ex Traore et al. 2017) TaxID=1841863 RepID=UPI001C8B96AA|nr:hypothetical protein [Gordonibacter massiliensis (ex Traore et al. 2017)]MBX9032686.1 hypothetical protein [Gordonibacter massiliensis (ex Traore et al. 2017)]
MGNDMTRKGFLAAAAAAGAAALVPSVAVAEEPDGSEAAPLAALDVEPVEGAEALAGSEWAAMAAGSPIDVVKSHSGMHVMNAPGYFVFTGWDEEHDWPADLGFGFTGESFAVKARDFNISTFGVHGKLADWVVESGTYGPWSYKKYASGTAECWIRRSYDVPMDAWSPSSFYPQGYAASAGYCSGLLDYPFPFSEPPCETFSLLGVEGGLCEAFAHSIQPNTSTRSGYYQVYRTALPEAATVTMSYSMAVRGRAS